MVGIIPAGAGKRRSVVTVGLLFGDHPRGCGEKGLAAGVGLDPAGSSPRVRGKVTAGRGMWYYMGIIPAGAGKSGLNFRNCNHSKDHPRGCGEKRRGLERSRRTAGSSPRVRGKAGGRLGGQVCGRIIPAGAGKRGGQSRRASFREDHPRGCGEKNRRDFASWNVVGSSPRVRGKDAAAPSAERQAGIIPAGAGKRVRREEPHARGWDHPRGCGEKDSWLASMPPSPGSSPRVRGKGSLFIAISP